MSISKELIPLVMGDRIAGQSYKQISDRYDLRYSEVRNTCREYKHQFGNLGEVSLADPTHLFSGEMMQPFNPSALIQRKGMRILDQMRKDDQIKAAMVFKKMAVLSTGWEIVSPEDQAPDWEPTQFLRKQFEQLEGSLDDTLMEAMTGLDYGFSVSEILFRQIDSGDFSGKIGLRAIKTRRPHEMDFEIDQHGNLKQLLQETNDGTLKLPPSKFLILTYQKEFANFYGKSDLESAYRAWWIKENAYRWLAMLLERFGIPPIFALYDPNSLTPQQITDLVNVINRIQAATSGALPRANADSLELWTPQLAGQTERVFIPALEMFNQDIARALLMPGLLGATADSQEGSFARAKVQFDVFLLIVSRIRSQLQDTLMDQVVKPLVQLNFGTEDEQLPTFRFLPLTDELRMDTMTQWGQFTGSGIVTPQESDEEHIRKSFGFPELDEKGPPPLVAQQETEQQIAEQQAALPPEGAAPAGAAPAPANDDADIKALEDEINAQLKGAKKNQELFDDYHDYRQPNSIEEHIDFAHIERNLDDIELRGLEKLVPAIESTRDKFLKFVGSNFDNNISFLSKVDKLTGLPTIRKAFIDTMMEAMTTGSKEVRKELKGLSKDFADNPNFNATAAARFLRSNADFFISGMNDSLTKKARRVLSNAIETGELLRDTQRSLKALFEPWVGNSSIVRDGEQIKPHRLETIIRTNATDSFNRGRLIEARKAGDLVTGFEYSAIIDSATTPVCHHLDEKIFLSDDSTLDEFSPPNHFNCRSILVPILLDEDIEDTEVVTEAQRGRARELQQAGFGKKPPVVRSFFEELEAYEYHQPGKHPQKRHAGGQGANEDTGPLDPATKAKLVAKVGLKAADEFINILLRIPTTNAGEQFTVLLTKLLAEDGDFAEFFEALEAAEFHTPGKPPKQHPQKRHGRKKGGKIRIPAVVQKGILSALRKTLQKKFGDDQPLLKAWGEGKFSPWTKKLTAPQAFALGRHAYEGATSIARLIGGDTRAVADILTSVGRGLDIAFKGFGPERRGGSAKTQTRIPKGQPGAGTFAPPKDNALDDEFHDYDVDEDLAKANFVIRLIDNALSTAVIPEDVLVYRGMQTSMFLGDEKEFVGTVLQNKSFTSTSMSKKTVIRNAPDEGNFVIFEILIPKDSQGAYLNEQLSPGEHEILLPRNSKFKVTSKRGKVIEMELI